MDTLTDGRMHGQHENSIPTTNKVCGGYNNKNVFETDSRNSHQEALISLP